MKYLHLILASVLMTDHLILGCNERIDLVKPRKSSGSDFNAANKPITPKAVNKVADRKV